MDSGNSRELKEIAKEIHDLKKSVDGLRGEIYAIHMVLQAWVRKNKEKEEKEYGIEQK